MVRETVALAGAMAAVVDEVVCVCPDMSAAAPKKAKTRFNFFTVSLDLGEIEKFLIFYMVREKCLNSKDRKGGDFSNHSVFDRLPAWTRCSAPFIRIR